MSVALWPVLLWVSGEGYVVDCDVDARGGLGVATFTATPAEARQFATGAEALDFWKRVSTVRPKRPDGKPNRPLTAYTVELVPAF